MCGIEKEEAVREAIPSDSSTEVLNMVMKTIKDQELTPVGHCTRGF